MRVLIDQWGDKVKPWETVQGRDGCWYTITDLDPEALDFQVGAVFEGGDPDEEGDWFPAGFLFLKVQEIEAEADPSGWRQEALKLWAE